jgi:hypothetical protein
MQIAYEIELKPELRSAIGLPNIFDQLFYIPKERIAIATNKDQYAITDNDSVLNYISSLEPKRTIKIDDPIELIIKNNFDE